MGWEFKYDLELFLKLQKIKRNLKPVVQYLTNYHSIEILNEINFSIKVSSNKLGFAEKSLFFSREVFTVR